MKEAFVEKAVTINDISDEHITISQMEEAFEKGFKKGLNIELKPLELTEAQLAEVEELTENIVQMNGCLESSFRIKMEARRLF